MDMGWDSFRKAVLKERVAVYATRAGDRTWKIEEYEETAPSDLPESSRRIDDSPEYERWRKTNVFPQKQEGYYYVFVTLPAGDITYDQFSALGRVSRRYAGGVLRTTRTQNLVFRWIRQDLLGDLYADLKKAGLAQQGAHSVFNVVGCPGADTCNLAITHSHTLALELHERFSQIPEMAMADDLKDLDIKVSGCPNSCGQHHIADIGFYGSAQRVQGKMAPYYTLLLGGEVSKGKAIFGQPTARVPAKNVPDAILRLVEMYRSKRNTGETFRDWIRRNQSESGNETTGMEDEVAVKGR
jgi:sulfite reductase beta subunit-like hemoprotein